MYQFRFLYVLKYLTLAALFSPSVASHAQQFIPGPFFKDEFKLGDHRDSNPANWMRGTFDADEDKVEEESLKILGIRSEASLAPVEPGGLPYWSYEDATLTTQVKILDGGGDVFAGVYGRSRNNTGVYFGGIWGDGRIRLGESDSLGNVINVEGMQTTFDTINKDILLKMVFDGAVMSLTAWEFGTDMPATPQLTYEDTTLTSGTVAMLGFGSGDVAFRWFEVAPVPEPSGAALSSFSIGLIAFYRKRRGKKRS